MRRLGALLVIVVTGLTWLPGSATAGGRIVIGPPVPVPHRPGFRVRPPRASTFVPAPLVLADPGTVIVPVPFPVPVPVVAAPAPPTADAAPPSSSEEVRSRPIVVNPGPKIIDVAPPAPGAKTATIVVQRGSTTVVETVPIQ